MAFFFGIEADTRSRVDSSRQPVKHRGRWSGNAGGGC
eukprot:COSAG02_NODE_25610_length_653_cov_1.341155_1_plen_36_part_10